MPPDRKAKLDPGGHHRHGVPHLLQIRVNSKQQIISQTGLIFNLINFSQLGDDNQANPAICGCLVAGGGGPTRPVHIRQVCHLQAIKAAAAREGKHQGEKKLFENQI